MAHVAVYLASDESDYMTGSSITPDGGFTLWFVVPDSSGRVPGPRPAASCLTLALLPRIIENETTMPRFAANLNFLFTEVPFLDRFEAAAKAGFKAVEIGNPYEAPPARSRPA